MIEGTSLEDHLIIFNEVVVDLKTLEVKYDEEDLSLIFLCSLPASYMSFRRQSYIVIIFSPLKKSMTLSM